MNAALAGTDPVIFFESQRLYDSGEMFEAAGVPEGYYEVPLGEPSIKKAGKDLTIITFGNRWCGPSGRPARCCWPARRWSAAA